jgi:glycogen debranching enzyme
MKEKLLQDIDRLKSSQGYLWAGFPNYCRLFGRDSLISAWQLLDSQPEIAKFTLSVLARHQGQKINQKKEEEPGKILHEHYDGGLPQKIRDLFKVSGKRDRIRQYLTWDFPYYGSVDSTAWWLILLSEYKKRTGDGQLVEELWPNVLKALEWIENYGDVDGDGFIEYQRKNPRGLFHQGWKDGLEIYIQPPIAIVEVQGYYYLVYQEFGLEKKAKNLKKKVNEQFWMPEQNYFALALDGRKEQVKVITSNPGQLLFTGILDDDKVEKVVKRLFEADIWTPYGIRTHSSKDPNFGFENYHQGPVWPHDNWIIYQGLQKYGFQKEAEMIESALISAYQALGYIPELYGVKEGKIFSIKNSCYLQAWASGALLNFLSKNGR